MTYQRSASGNRRVSTRCPTTNQTPFWSMRRTQETSRYSAVGAAGWTSRRNEFAIACRVRPRIMQCARRHAWVHERVPSYPTRAQFSSLRLSAGFYFLARGVLLPFLVVVVQRQRSSSSREDRGERGIARRKRVTEKGREYWLKKGESGGERERRRKEAESLPFLREPLHARSLASTLLRRSLGLDHPAIDSLTVLYATPLCLKETGLSPSSPLL